MSDKRFCRFDWKLLLGSSVIFAPIITIAMADVIYPGKYMFLALAMWSIPISIHFLLGVRIRKCSKKPEEFQGNENETMRPML